MPFGRIGNKMPGSCRKILKKPRMRQIGIYMFKSMTAFGRDVQSINGKNITVEIKSVNNRYFDCSVKLPHVYSPL